MKVSCGLIFGVLALAGCSQDPAGVRITNTPVAAPVALKGAKTEPVFYNGKTYQVSLSPLPGGGATVSIAGMGAAQAKDASSLATSALHHFACKDTQRAVLDQMPQFVDSAWRATGRCA